MITPLVPTAHNSSLTSRTAFNTDEVSVVDPQSH